MFSSPEAVILFGGLTKAGDLILKPTRENMESNLIQVFQNKVKIPRQPPQGVRRRHPGRQRPGMGHERLSRLPIGPQAPR